MSDLVLTGAALVAAKSVLGPTLNEIGQDLKKLYAAGRDKILEAAHRKLQDPRDGKTANLRVAHDVFLSGAFTDDEICAEYFGGVLAGSRSHDGKDDSNIQYLSVIKSLSSSQLRLHYFIYTGLNQLLCQSFDPTGETSNVRDSGYLASKQIYFCTNELQGLGVNTDTDFHVLNQQNLIGNFKGRLQLINNVDHQYFRVKPLEFYSVCPTTYGIILFAAAHNKLGAWHEWVVFDRCRFEHLENIQLPKLFAPTLEELTDKWVAACLPIADTLLARIHR